MNRVLYLFLTHQGSYDVTRARLGNQKDCIIIVGGYDTTHYDSINGTLYLNCDDSYAGLPEKVIKAFRFVYENFKEYTHVCKLDEDVMPVQPFDSNILKNDYFGCINFHNDGDRSYHFGKVPLDSKWNNVSYQGRWAPWALGGYGYGVSMHALSKIVYDETYDTHIYEDVYIGVLLKDENITPHHIPNITDFIKTYWSL
jgi:hypothetical protein